MSFDTWEELDEALSGCRTCPRLTEWRERVAIERRRAYRDWVYWGRPVPGFGDRHARLLIVGLAPGAHGSNRTGRMFTGDASGDFLYPALYRAGFANRSLSERCGDGLILYDAYITAVGRCAPPENRPTPQELEWCRPYLVAELRLLKQVQGIVALGQIALNGVLAAYRLMGAVLPSVSFGHGVLRELGPGMPWLITSYHPSRQNTQTGRLTAEMFDAVWQVARSRLVDV